MDVELKKDLANLGEEAALWILDQAESIGKKIAARSDNTIDDVALTVFGMLKSEIVKQIDKIDGEVG